MDGSIGLYIIVGAAIAAGADYFMFDSPEADAKKMCACMEAALDEEGAAFREAINECQILGSEFQQKYADKPDQKQKKVV